MAHMNATPPHAGFFGTLLDRVLSAFARIGENNSRVREADRLRSLSDSQLADLGVKREDIARHVFRDMFYV